MKTSYFRFWRWHVSVITLLVAFAVSVSTSTPALASSVPGEGNQWNAEYYDSGTGALRINTGETLSEAYNGSNLVQVWRGSDNNHVWFSVNHGQAFTLGNSATYVAPRIVAFGTGFAAFHTGVDGRIYWAILPYGNPGTSDNWGPWNAISGNQTFEAVSVASIPGTTQIMMVYRSTPGVHGQDDWVWSTFFDRYSWSNAVVIPNGHTLSAPALTWNNAISAFATVIRGRDNNAYLSYQPYGGTWDSWQPVGVQGAVPVGDEPAIASLPNGNMQIAIRHHYDNSIYLGEMYNTGTSFLFSGWTQESQHWRSNYAPFLSAVGAAIYIIITGLDRTAYWKPSFR